jgi:hypothetical protein
MTKIILMFCGAIADVWIAAYLIETYRSWYSEPILITAIIIGVLLVIPLLLRFIDAVEKL